MRCASRTVSRSRGIARLENFEKQQVRRERGKQAADELQVIPATVRTWIQSGALRASRPGNGAQPGRTYRVRRTDLDAFVAASQSRPASPS